MTILFRNGHNLTRHISGFHYFKDYLKVLSSYYSSTMKYLNVAEKNDAAKNIAQHLSRGTSRRVNFIPI